MSYQRLIELSKLISIYDNAYHNLDIQLITDQEYDTLYAEWKNLSKLFPDHELNINPGFVENEGLLVPITEPMLSVNKFNDKDKFLKLRKRYNDFYTIEEKLDGVGVRIIYNKDGSLKTAHLRGDGRGGRAISHRLYLIDNIPEKITSSNEEIVITGEVVCTNDDFKNYCIEYGLVNKSARSVVAGFLRRDEKTVDETLQLHFIGFHVSKNIRDKCKTYSILVKWLWDNKITTPATFNEFPINKPESVFPIDGVVIKDNCLEHWDNQSTIGYYSYAGCFKYPTTIGKTKVTGVTWGVTTQGILTAVLNFKPIKLNGAILSRCQFHYSSTFIKNGIRIGSEIEVTRGNEVIPKLIGMIEPGDGKLITFPDNCPYCNTQLEQLDGIRQCVNNNCTGQITVRLLRAVSDKGLDINGIGEKKATQLIANNIISLPHDIFTLTKEDLGKVGIKGKKASKLIIEISNRCKSKSLACWLFALGIPELGEVRSLIIEDELRDKFSIPSIKETLEILSSLDALTELFGVDGIKIVSYVSPNFQDIEIFLSYFDWKEYEKRLSNGSIEEVIPISITGKLNVERKILKDILKMKGYCLDNIVTKNSLYLLIGKKPSPGKVALAERYDIPTIDVTNMNIDNIIKFLEARK